MIKFEVGEKFYYQGYSYQKKIPCKVLELLDNTRNLYYVMRLSDGYTFNCGASRMIKVESIKRNKFKESPYS